jgi:DNA-directed RNA polymerase subunit RPC12/RpoP
MKWRRLVADTKHWKDSVETLKYCPECDSVREEGEIDRAYECGECSNKFTAEEADGSNRCPECGKFGSKIADECCTDCYAELEEIQGIEVGGEYIVMD